MGIVLNKVLREINLLMVLRNNSESFIKVEGELFV